MLIINSLGRKIVICALIIIAFLVIDSSQAANKQKIINDNKQPIDIEHLQKFARVIEYIKRYYVDDVDNKKLFDNAIRGMLTGLDPHSTFLDNKEVKNLKANTSGKFGGLGIEVTVEDGLIKIIAPIDDTPAAKAGLQSGDLILKIDEQDVKDITLAEAVDKMRGKPGSPINLIIFRQAAGKALKYTIVRDVIKVQSVKAKLVDDKFGYIKITQFQFNTAKLILEKIKSLKQEAHNHKLQGMIIDLRNNPGGVLDAAVQVSDLFLNSKKLGLSKLIVYTKGRAPATSLKEYATTNDILNNIPLVVLVNNGSASASEIVAGALQDHKRALIIGETTFGKGSVQSVLPLANKEGVKLTTALYYTPEGRSIQAQGIKPDIIVKNNLTVKIKNKNDENNIDLSYKEADLKGHLRNQKLNNSNINNIENKKNKEISHIKKQNLIHEKLIEKDFQLYETINVLKTLIQIRQAKLN